MDTEFLKSLLVPLDRRSRHYVPPKQPTLLMLSTGGTSDRWCREEIRGVTISEQPKLQMVVVENGRDASDLFAAWCMRKQARGIIIGGACQVLYEGPETIAREKARYAQ